MAAQTASRQCWECTRRRLVCDMTLPKCRKCAKTKVDCPGYDAQKPLKWVAPGKVQSRPRKKKQPLVLRTESPRPADDDRRNDPNVIGKYLRNLKLRTEADDVVEAVAYYNREIYPFLVTAQLEGNPYIIPFPLVHHVPVSSRHALVGLALGHFMNRVPRRPNDETGNELALRLHHHTDIAIRTLKVNIELERENISDATCASIMMLMFLEIVQSRTPKWRAHVEAIAIVVKNRGGLDNMVAATPHMSPALLSCIILQITANTTSPSADQIHGTAHFQMIDTIVKLYEMHIYPNFICPSSLFAELIRINHLRAERVRPSNSESDSNSHLQQAADEIVQRIVDFSVEEWAKSRLSHHVEWKLAGDIYQSAIVLFALLSLEDLITLPYGKVQAAKSLHHARLFQCLPLARQGPPLKFALMWPMLVAGVAAQRGTLGERRVIANMLKNMQTDFAMPVIVATEALGKFWGNQRPCPWDQCWEQPHALVM